jgi:protein dithiol oxidoreductase (disulfide-forming)
MTRYLAAVLALLSLVSMPVAHAATNWTEGQNYYRIDPPKRGTNLPASTVEVIEVFSYGCPACNQFVPIADKLKSVLPANAKLAFLPASFNAAEGWPTFQRAYFTAQALGIADKTHDAMFAAVWKTGELGITDPNTGRPKGSLPTIEDIARWYNKQTGVAVDKFVSTAKSFSIEVKIKAADDLITTYQVDRTPTIIVNGKYRLHPQSAGGFDQLIELVKYLVAKESAAK